MSSSDRGFSLIELLVAMAIFGISVSGFAAALLSDMRANRTAQEISDATALAQDTIESYRAASPVCSSSGIFTRACALEENTPIAGARTITVTVSWLDGGARSVSLKSVLTN